MTRVLVAISLAMTLGVGGFPSATAQHFSGRYFGGYPCTDDCSEHAAGFRWAASQHVRNAEDCLGEPRSFREGCRAYVRNRLRDASRDDDGKPIR
jgi:hypothetical protein